MNAERKDIERIAENSLLYDFYGQLLSKRQREVMALYHEENLSLSEIAEEFGISRQAVHDTLKKAEQALGGYEQKLGLLGKLMASKKAITEIDEKIDGIIAELVKVSETAHDGTNAEAQAAVIPKLNEIKDIINTLDA